MNREKQKGQLIIVGLLFLALILTMSTALIGYTTLQIRGIRQDVSGTQALEVAEAGIDQAIYKLNQTPSYSGETGTSFAGGQFTISVSSIDSNNKLITATGYVPNATNPTSTRIVKAVANLNTSTISFNTGVQVGAGGLTMNNNASVSGNIFSNGSISGANGATITGNAIVAGGVATSPDQQWTLQNNNFVFADTAAHTYAAESFKPSTTNKIMEVQIYLKSTGTPNDLVVQIVSDNAGVPSGTVLASGSILAANVTSGYSWIQSFLTSNPTLASGTKYWIELVSSPNASNYYTWGSDGNNGYGNGIGVYSANNTSWTNAGANFDFQIFMGTATTSLSNVTVTGNAYAHTLTSCSITGNAFYASSNTCSVGGTLNSGQTDQPPQGMPISSAQISQWEATAAAGGVYNGTYTVTTTTSMGPYEINGDLVVNGTLNMTGPIWVKGSVTFGNGAHGTVDPALGNAGAVLLADNPTNLSGSGSINISNDTVFAGNGNPGSYTLVISTNTSGSAINLSNNTVGAIFYAANGIIQVSNNVHADQLTGYGISLANANFSNGPGAGWTYSKGTYIIAK